MNKVFIHRQEKSINLYQAKWVVVYLLKCDYMLFVTKKKVSTKKKFTLYYVLNYLYNQDIK